MKDRFDVFLCHNSEDKSAVKKIGLQLKEKGLRPWLDEWEIRTGILWQSLLEKHIDKIDAVAVFIGPSGIGPWQQREIEIYLRAFVNRGCPVIPVILPGVSKLPVVPIFLEGLTLLDFRQNEPDPLERLIWGITGKRPGSRVTPSRVLPTSGRYQEKNHVNHIFISYSHDDGDFAEVLKGELEVVQVKVWTDESRLVAGEDWREGIDQAIKDALALIVVMTPTAKASEYVTYEWAFAWGIGVKVIPVLLKPTSLHPRLEVLQYLDFTHRTMRPWNKLIDLISELLAKKQPETLETLAREERDENKARLSLDLFEDKPMQYRFRITNISAVNAMDVDLELLVEKPKDNPIIPSDYATKFPVKKMQPGNTVTLIAALHSGIPTAYSALLKWTNPDGSNSQEKTYVAL